MLTDWMVIALLLRLCCAINNSMYLEYIPQLDTITRSTVRYADGIAYPSSAPGVGIEWDWEAIDALNAEHFKVNAESKGL